MPAYILYSILCTYIMFDKLNTINLSTQQNKYCILITTIAITTVTAVLLDSHY